MRREPAALRLLVGALLVVAGACSRSRERPNVLLITVDTLRADRLGCYGFGLAHTPAIDRLAAEGVRCADAATSAPITLPAHSSIMTGLYPAAHGVRDNGNYALAPEAVTLAERLHDAGYRTAAFVSALVLARRYGLDQGFDLYDDDLWSEDEPPLFMIRKRPAPRTVDRALAWLREWKDDHHDRPFFVWMHLFDPHEPYESRSPDLAALAPTPYDAEVAEADRGIGRVLDWLRAAGVLDHTLVVFTADHGESLGEHGEPTHGIFLYDATVHVPLIWRLPGVLPEGSTYPGPARHVDIVPTVLALLGLPGADAVQGVNLLPALEGRAAPPDLPQYSEARLAEEGFGMAPLSAVRHAGRKWIHAPRPELYDLGRDPKELDDLYAAMPAAARPLQADEDAVLADSARHAIAARPRTIDHETGEMLRALGYLAAPEDRAAMAGRDPKDGMVLYAELTRARQLAQGGRWDAAERTLAQLVATSPENVTARNVLALAAVRRGDVAEAERQYEESLRYQPRQHRVLDALGAIALRHGDPDAAERRFHAALDLAPTYVEAMSNLGFVAVARGDASGAQAWYERAIAVDPTYPHVYRRLADLYYDRHEWARAREYYERVLAVLPRYFEVLVQAGNSARFAGDADGAAWFYATAGDVRPDSWIPPYNLACLRAVNGDTEQAMRLLDRAVDVGLKAPQLLDENEDFASVRTQAAWPALLERARNAASVTGSGAAMASGPR